MISSLYTGRCCMHVIAAALTLSELLLLVMLPVSHNTLQTLPLLQSPRLTTV